MISHDLKNFLDAQFVKFNNPAFIEKDPISVPHQFSLIQDIEIIGFWTAMLAWGQRITIIKKANQLVQLMDGAPYDFIINHEEKDRKRFETFKHRTFQATDALYFIEFFSSYYKMHNSLEWAFSPDSLANEDHMEKAIIRFQDIFFSFDPPDRCRKHVASPFRNSTCKRINMFLRWMVRRDPNGVDFGLWHSIKPAQLLIPLDTHVDKVARSLGLLKRKQTDWKAVLELTNQLRKFDPVDPVKYDYALFGLGILQYDQLKN